MEDEDRLINEPIKILLILTEIRDCIDVLKRITKCKNRLECESDLRQARYQLLTVVQKLKSSNSHSTILCSKQDMEREIFMAEIEMELEETRISHLRKEWSQQQYIMAKLQNLLARKSHLLTVHSNYCSSQGSSLCEILTIVMSNKELIETFLCEPETYLVKFIKIAYGCLFSFTKTYSLEKPLDDITDYKYILALFMCIHHITKTKRGRLFLTVHNGGQFMISEILMTLSKLKHFSSDTLKLLLLEIVYNISQEEEGVYFLRSCSVLLPTLDSCIIKPYHPRIHKLLLEIIDAITKNNMPKDFLDKLTETINMERLQELSEHNFQEVNRIPKLIFRNIRYAAQSFILEKQAQGDIQRDKCVSTPISFEAAINRWRVINSFREDDDSEDSSHSYSTSDSNSISPRRQRMDSSLIASTSRMLRPNSMEGTICASTNTSHQYYSTQSHTFRPYSPNREQLTFSNYLRKSQNKSRKLDNCLRFSSSSSNPSKLSLCSDPALVTLPTYLRMNEPEKDTTEDKGMKTFTKNIGYISHPLQSTDKSSVGGNLSNTSKYENYQSYLNTHNASKIETIADITSTSNNRTVEKGVSKDEQQMMPWCAQEKANTVRLTNSSMANPTMGSRK